MTRVCSIEGSKSGGQGGAAVARQRCLTVPVSDHSRCHGRRLATLLCGTALALQMTSLTTAARAETDATSDGSGVEAVVVTAQRRSESIQKASLSVSAISSQTIEKFGMADFSDYARTIPSLSFGTGNGFGLTTAREVTIRGIFGTNTTNFYLNDTPVPLSLDPRILDVRQIEVLRGPQGVLFGASSMGGTVRIITKAAETDGDYGFAEGKAFGVNYGGAGYDVSGSYNVDLLEGELALKANIYNSFKPGVFKRLYGYATTDGYVVPSTQQTGEVKHLGNDAEYGGAVTLTYTPKAIPGLTVTPLIVYQDMHGNGLPLADYDPSNFTQVRPLNIAEGVADKWLFTALTLKYDAGFGTFISSSTYLHRSAFDNEDGTEAATVVFGVYADPQLSNEYQASPSPSWVNSVSYTQEIRFESRLEGPIQIVTGAYYNDGHSMTIQRELTPYDSTGAAAFTENVPRTNHELAGFINLTYAVTDSIEVAAGVRQAQLSYTYRYFADGWINGGHSDSPTAHKETATTPRFTAKWQITATDMVYSNIAKGYRVGGQNPNLPSICDASLAAVGMSTGNSSYNSDSLWSYEVGAKDTWWSGRINTRISAYHIDWTNMQQSILLSCDFHVNANAGAAISEGFELEADVAPIDGLNVNLSGGYDHARITSAPSGSAFWVGQPLNGVPKWNVSALADYVVPLDFAELYFRGKYSFTGSSVSFNSDSSGRPRKSYQMVDLRTGLTIGEWDLSLYAENLFDVRANLGDEQSEISEIPGRARYLVSQPRTIGIDVKHSF